MNKKEYIEKLEKALSGLPRSDVEERLAFYEEMIDDRIEEGMSEEEAVAGAGDIDSIVSQTIADVPLTRIIKENTSGDRRLKWWEIALLILGFPLWFPLLIAAGAVLLSIYIVIWALIISLWAIEVSLWACALGGLVIAVIYFASGKTFAGIALLGAALLCAGLSIFMFFACIGASKGILRLTKKAASKFKALFIRKGKSK
ncbi:MAG: DUF1700 domain-containing protein [Clostridia bacterium]|nr:DUF1700 domain-containing protein [Clostridia bacterium]